MIGNKWLEEVLSGESTLKYNPLYAMAAAITIRQYQKANGYPVNRVMFKVEGEWRDMDEILAGPDDESEDTLGDAPEWTL